MTRSALLGFLFIGLLTAACWNIDNRLESDGGTDTDADTDTDSDADTDTDDDTDTDTDSETDTDTDLPTDCTGLDDFTLCSVVTTPDRSYDICISGVCQSPGCGSVACNPPGPHFPLPDTSQRLCYDATTTMTCAAPGEAFYGQDAQYGWDTTHATTERFARDTTTSPTDPLVTDNVTGLMWQGCEAGRTGAMCESGASATYTWVDALAYCEGLDWGGHTDWRLPDRYELQSIVGYGVYIPSIDTAAFPATMTDLFWSSTSCANFFYNGWVLFFSYGRMYISDKGYPYYARCVRGGPTPQPERFTRDTTTSPTDPLVTDNVTGLMWQGCEAGRTGAMCESGASATYTWVDALAYCEGLDWGGHTDWRLPNVDELTSIVDDHTYAPSIDTTAFPATTAHLFWSSTSRVAFASESDAWMVYFIYGVVSYNGKAGTIRARCVRSGP